MISEEALKARVISFARRVDIDPPDIVVRQKAFGDMSVHLSGRTLSVQSHTLAELSDAELDFALALAFSRYVKTRWALIPIWAGSLAAGLLLGVLALIYSEDYFALHFWSGFWTVLGCATAGYVVAEILHAWYRRVDQNAVFHDAIMLAGSPTAAESYLIRLQAERGASKLRKRLSQRRKDTLEFQLQSLEEACRRLGLNYRAVTSKLN